MLNNIEIFVPFDKSLFNISNVIFDLSRSIKAKAVNLYPNFIETYELSDRILSINLNLELPYSKNSNKGKELLYNYYLTKYSCIRKINLGLNPLFLDDTSSYNEEIQNLKSIKNVPVRVFLDTGMFEDEKEIIDSINLLENTVDEIVLYGYISNFNCIDMADRILSIRREISIDIGGVFRLNSFEELAQLDNYNLSSILLKPKNILGINT